MYVDWLRVIALAGVFVIHVLSVFDPWDEWHITSVERSRIAGTIIVCMAPWIMPLFMLLAGVSAWFSLEKRGNAEFLRERFIRLFIPLIAGTLLLVPPQVYLERRLRGQFDGSFWEFYPHFFDGIYPHGNFSWHHLWFLGHLLAYSVVALPIMRHLQRARGQALLARLARVCRGPGGLLWLALPLVLERHLLWWLFPERHMLASDWSNHALLFVAYLYGFILAGNLEFGRMIDAQWRRAFATACVTTGLVVTGAWIGVIPWRLPEPYSLGYLAFWTIYAVGAWAAMVAALGIARRWFSAEHSVLRYARDAGYGLYVVHQPIIVAIAYLVVRSRLHGPSALAVLLVFSFLGTLAAAEVVRRLPITRALFASRSPE